MKAPKAVIALAMLVIGFAHADAARGDDGPSYRPDEVIVKFKPSASEQQRQAILSGLGAWDVKSLGFIGALHTKIRQVSVEDAVSRYKKDAAIEFIEPNYIYHALVIPNDPQFGQLWGLRNTGQTGGTPGADISATRAWDASTGSPGVLVAMIDTGVDYTHSDLAANIFVNPGEIPGNGVDDDGNGFVDDVRGWDFANNDNDPIDDHGHGTHTAGTVGAVGNNGIGVVGVDWQIKLLPIKFLDAFGSGTEAAAVSSIDYATRMGARVMSNSWGGDINSEALRQAVQRASDAGVMFVAAAGNLARDNDLIPNYPSNYDAATVIAVAATDHNDQLASFSNYGATTVDLAAPGVDILSTVPGGYGYASGTSMSTPHVAGAVALIFARFPSISAVDAKALLLDRVDPRGSLAGRMLTGGRLNAFLPIAEPDSLPPAAIADLSVSDVNATRATLHWTASGDDGAVGQASRYDVRYSTSPIDAGNFDAATPAAGPPEPLPAGSSEQMVVRGLSFSTPYYFAVKVIDELGNRSPISNLATATTLGPPDIAVTPSFLSADLLTGQTATRTLTIANTGAGELTFRISAEGVRPPVPFTSAPRMATASAEARRGGGDDPPAGSPGSDRPYDLGHTPGRGRIGPDATRLPTPSLGGNARILLLQSGADVSEIQALLLAYPDVANVDVLDCFASVPTLAQLTPYDATIVVVNRPPQDPVGVGNVLADYADQGGGVVMTLASFISGFEVGGRFVSGGYSPFDLGSGPDGSAGLGAFDAAHPIMAGVTAATGGLLGIVNLASGAELIASWNNGLPCVATKGDNVAAVNVFVGATGFWTGDVPLILHNAAIWAGKPVTWLGSEPMTGVVPAGGSLDVTITIDARGLDGGNYEARLLVESEDPDENPAVVPVSLHVTGAPDIVVAGEEVRLESQESYGADGARTTHSFAVGAPAAAGGTLELVADGDFGDFPETATVIAEGTVVGSAGHTGIDCASATGSFALSADFLAALTADGRVDVEVQNSPDVNVFCPVNRHTVRLRYERPADPTDFGMVFFGGSREITLRILNPGTQTLDVASIASDLPEFVPAAAALSIPPRGSRALAIRFTPSAVAPFSAELRIQSNDPDRPVVVIALRGEGVVAPNIGISPPSLSADLLTGETSAQTLTIENTGGSPLTFEVSILPPPASPSSSAARAAPASPSSLPSPFSSKRWSDFRSPPASRAEPRLASRPNPSVAALPPVVVDPAGDGGVVDITVLRGTSTSAGLEIQMDFSTNVNPSDFGGFLSLDVDQNRATGFPPSFGLPTQDIGVEFEFLFFSLQFGIVQLYDVRTGTLVGQYPVDIEAHSLRFSAPLSDIGHDDGAMDVTGVIGNAFGPTDWFPDVGHGSITSLGWITVNPTSGTVLPGSSVTLGVTFDAAGLFGGDYAAVLDVVSNDPDQGEIPVSARLHVTGAPDIALSDSVLAFGAVFVGASRSDTIEVSNTGTDLLRVTGIAASDPDYTADAASFDLAPLERRNVVVTFHPTRPGPIPAALSVASNDRDEPLLTVPLSGDGLEPPDIAVTPDSMSADLLTGARTTRTMTIRNTGRSDLVWQTFVRASASALAGPTASRHPSALLDEVARGSPGDQPPTHKRPAGFVASATRPSTMAGSTALLVQDTPPWGTRSNEDVLEANGIAYDVISSSDLGTADLSRYRHLIVPSDQPTSYYFAVAAQAARIEQFVTQGGVLEFHASGWGFAGGDASLVTLPGGMHINQYYAPLNYVLDPAHPLMAGVPDPFSGSSASHSYFSAIPASAALIASDDVGRPNLVVYRLGGGTIVAGCQTMEFYYVYGGAPGIILQNMIPYAHGLGPSWLTTEPSSGVVPAGGSVDVNVTFDASGLIGGDYANDIVVQSNDPDEPEVIVTCRLHVTGAPDIAVSDSVLAYGQVYVGAASVDSFEVSNVGTDLLRVTGLTVDNAAFLPDTGGFDLGPGGRAVVAVRFFPDRVGSFSGTLSISSNDPDEGKVSIALSGEGVTPPRISATPDSIHSELAPDDRETRIVTVRNTGGSDLIFDISAASTAPNGAGSSMLEASVARAGSMPAAHYAKTEADPRRGAPVTERSGGPDAFGYRWIDSDEPGGPIFNWVEISAVGIQIPVAGDDGNFGPLPIGFDFPFYGNVFSQFRLCTNGWVSFTSGATDFVNQPLPNSFAPENLLAAFWDDLVMPGPRAYFYQDGTRLIIEYQAVPNLGVGGPYTFEIILYPDGRILYQYLQMTPPNDNATIGIQNATRDVGLTVAFNAAYVHDNLAIRFEQQPRWLTVSPTSGRIPPGGSLPVSVTLDATGLLGTYRGVINLDSNDPLSPHLGIPVTLEVTTRPALVIEPGRLDFGEVYLGYTRSQVVTLRNRGGAPLVVSAITPGLGDYSVDRSSLTLAPNQSAPLTVTFAPSVTGNRDADLVFTSNDPHSPQAIPLSGTGLVAPGLDAAPDLFEARALPGGSRTRTLRICNTGGSDLHFDVRAVGAAGPSGGAAAAAVQQQATGGGGAAAAAQPLASGGGAARHAVSSLAVEPLGGAAGVLAARGSVGTLATGGPAGVLATGGPDLFGHVWLDSDQPGGPVFDWIDISGIGTRIPFAPFSDDINVGPLPIGFRFPFYGDTFDSFRACTNGFISFTSRVASGLNRALPSSFAAVPENLIAPFWDDLVHATVFGSSAYYHSDGERLVVQFNRMLRSGDNFLPLYTFEIILHRDGRILLQYLELGPNRASATVGIQNGPRDDGLTVVYNASYLHDGLAVAFEIPPAWIHVAPATGTVAAGGCADVEVRMDATELPLGEYFATIVTRSNDPARPAESADVRFQVVPPIAADVKFEPNTLNSGSNGSWVAVRVGLPEPFRPEDVAIGTVRLNGVVPADPSIEVVQSLSEGSVVKLKFPRSEVQRVLPESESAEATVTGEFLSEDSFSGRDSVRVIRPQLTAPNGGEVLAGGRPVEVTWDVPSGWHPHHADLYLSSDGGASWSPIGQNIQTASYSWMVPPGTIPEARVRVQLFDEYGLMGYDSSDGPFRIFTLPAGLSESVQPRTYALGQNAPNPFRLSTAIGFDLPVDSPVRLRVYDPAGRLVRLLEDGWMPAGRHQARWDGRDQAGNRLTPGVYLYRIEAAGYRVTKRMVLIE